MDSVRSSPPTKKLIFIDETTLAQPTKENSYLPTKPVQLHDEGKLNSTNKINSGLLGTIIQVLQSRAQPYQDLQKSRR